MPDPCRPFRQLARNSLLANRRLHRACAALAPGEWEARRVSFFPSLKATLNHILIVDRFYWDAVFGGRLGPAAWADEQPYATVAELADAQGRIDTAAAEFCEGLAAESLGGEVRIHRAARVQVETIADTLMHVFLHGQHHRGQAHAMLAGTPVRPPQLDEFFMADDAATRAADLAAAGRDEAWIMR